MPLYHFIFNFFQNIYFLNNAEVYVPKIAGSCWKVSLRVTKQTFICWINYKE